MLKDIKRNSQGIIISTQLVDFGDDYSYIQLERFVRKFNQNTEQTSKSTFSEVYDDRITDIEFEEIKVANSYTFIDKSTGKEINLNDTDPAFLISELNPNLTESTTTTSAGGGVGTVGGTTTTSAGGSVGMLTSAGGSVGMLTSAGGTAGGSAGGSTGGTTTTSAGGSAGTLTSAGNSAGMI